MSLLALLPRTVVLHSSSTLSVLEEQSRVLRWVSSEGPNISGVSAYGHDSCGYGGLPSKPSQNKQTYIYVYVYIYIYIKQFLNFYLTTIIT